MQIYLNYCLLPEKQRLNLKKINNLILNLRILLNYSGAFYGHLLDSVDSQFAIYTPFTLWTIAEIYFSVAQKKSLFHYKNQVELRLFLQNCFYSLLLYTQVVMTSVRGR